MQNKLKQCVECEVGKLSVLWQSNPPLCKYHSQIKTAKKQVAERKAIYPIKDDEMKVEGIAERDEKFFNYAWQHSEHICAECGKELKTFSRYFVHHILSKAKHKYFRWDIRNTIILCYQHHNEIESAISAPKLKVFKYCESVKKELLESIGMSYEPKIITTHERI